MNIISNELLLYIKQYLRIEPDWTEDDNILSSFIFASISYIESATGIIFDETNDLHKLALALFTANQYENRLPIGKGFKLAYSLESILFQLNYSGSGTV